MRMNNNKLGLVALTAVLACVLQVAASAQNGCGYYSNIAPRCPIDVRMSVLYDRLEVMYNSGLLAPQERAELARDLDGIQFHEIRSRCFNPYGISKCAAQHLNRELDVFTARLDARGTAS